MGQPMALKRIDELKQKLLGTDRKDHWNEVLEMEKSIKEALLKKDLSKHQGVKLFLDYIVKEIRQTNELLTLAKSDQLTTSQRDALIEKRDFAVQIIQFFDLSGRRLKELEAELDYQLEDDEDGDIEDAARGE